MTRPRTREAPVAQAGDVAHVPAGVAAQSTSGTVTWFGQPFTTADCVAVQHAGCATTVQDGQSSLPPHGTQARQRPSASVVTS